MLQAQGLWQQEGDKKEEVKALRASARCIQLRIEGYSFTHQDDVQRNMSFKGGEYDP